MYTYQDLLNVGENDIARGKFCRDAVTRFMGTAEYASAQAGEAYYNKHNLTIEHFKKFLYTLSGKQVEDIFGANYKLKTTFFRRLVQQQVQYVLGNGIILQEQGNKEKLGEDFDFQVATAAKRAMSAGKAFGFWNLDHLEIFGYADTPAQPGFCPLYSETDSKLMAGIRFWFRWLDNKLIFRATLYEADGITEYRQVDSGDPVVLKEKQAYKQIVKGSLADGVQEVIGENYTDLPIVCLYANDSHESELEGMRECFDAYDLIKSGFANNIDDFDGFFWLVKNAGGMDDPDLAKFVQRLKTVHAAAVDGDDGASAEPHKAEVPTEARRTMLEILRSDIYEDFQSVDVKSLSAAAKTTQEIQAAFQSMDNKCADFEYFVLDFVQKILTLAGIDDTPTLNWNRMINQNEQTQMILSASQYLTDESVLRHLPFLTPEEVDDIIEERDSEDYQQFNAEEDEAEGMDEELDEDEANAQDEVLAMLDELLAELEG